MMILDCLPTPAAETIKKLIEEAANKAERNPRLMERSRSIDSTTDQRDTFLDHFKDYPEIPNDIIWTNNRPRFCSSCTEKNPNTHILDDNLKSFWVVPVLHNAWTILDLQYDHIITGITIYGWSSPQMLKTFQLQKADQLEGPWMTMTSHTCESLGSTDPKQAAFPQKFKDFTFRSRFVRLYLVDNHGGSYMCFQGIQLRGADCRVIDTLQDCGLMEDVEKFISKGMNTWKKFLDISPADLEELAKDNEKRVTLLEIIYAGRRKEYPMKVLKWLTPPVTSVFVGETLPDISIQSDPGVTELMQVEIQGGAITGNACCRFISGGDGKASTCTFNNIAIQTVGMFTILVKSMTSDVLLAAPRRLEVRPKIQSQTDIISAFDEIENMLSEMNASLPSTD